ncbi:PadR family transcriptional regulator [Salmonella enterica subsp. enterica serovar Choleraesuis]|nr:PadR family transcriptional regulator [Salmonella enterica subsp. enterica serovar Choleraesuis]
MMLLARSPSHGYELIKAIEDLTLGHYAPSPGVIYPTLEWLRDMALIDEDPESDGKRRLLITAAGRQWLQQHEEQRLHIEDNIRQRNIGHQLRRDPQMQRALANLKSTLDIRINQQQATPEQMLQIIKLLDEAAAAIAQV